MENSPTTQTQPIAPEAFNDKLMSMFVHLATFTDIVVPLSSIVVKVVLWKINVGKSAFFERQAKEAINFEISIYIYSVISFLLIFVIIGIPLFMALIVFNVVCSIIAAVKSHNGEDYRYPLTIRFIK